MAVACVGSRLADAVALRLFDGPAEGLPEALASAQHRYGRWAPLTARRRGANGSLSLDAAGSPLFRRGWRARVGAAPLRETLAAGLLRAAGYTGEEPLLDPMCGSGTIALEAYAIASRHPPGHGRSFAFEGWPGHDPKRTASVRERLAAGLRAPPFAIHASDRNGGALRLAQKNAASAGLPEGAIHFERADAAELSPPFEHGLLTVNPPYGVRLDAEVESAWGALAGLMDRWSGWRAAVVAPGGMLFRLARAPEKAIEVQNGGIRCRLAVYWGSRV